MPRVITLEGAPRERGLAYGDAVRPLIVEAAARWQADAGRQSEDVLTALLARTRFRAAARQFTPYLVEEIDGIAQASGVDQRLVWALNLLDESWWVRPRPDAGCSAL